MKKMLLVCVFVLSGCAGKDVLGGCTKRTETLDAVYGDPSYSFELSLVDIYEKKGWKCEDVPLRNAFGAHYGDRYTCTGCDS